MYLCIGRRDYRGSGGFGGGYINIVYYSIYYIYTYIYIYIHTYIHIYIKRMCFNVCFIYIIHNIIYMWARGTSNPSFQTERLRHAHLACLFFLVARNRRAQNTRLF